MAAIITRARRVDNARRRARDLRQRRGVSSSPLRWHLTECGAMMRLPRWRCRPHSQKSRRTMKAPARALCATAVLVLIACGRAGAATISSDIPQSARTSVKPVLRQGCVNQGSDARAGAPVVCWAQRRLSWRSKREPHFLLLGKRQNTSVGLAWPPYLVLNSPEKQGRWRMFRIGFRYDRTWHGYIFPTAAWKSIKAPLKY